MLNEGVVKEDNDRMVDIQLIDIKKKFGSTEALRGLTLKVVNRDRVALLGRNGAGKSTTLKITAGLMQQDSGFVEIRGRPVSESREILGYLPEDAVPYLNLTPLENMEYIGSLRRIGDLENRIDELFTLLELTRYSRIKTMDLSRGNRQKLSISLSMIHNPEILLLDEPLSYLDVSGQESLIELLEREHRTLLLSTHMMSLASRLADRVVIISDGVAIWDGKKADLEQKMKPDESFEHLVARMMNDVL